MYNAAFFAILVIVLQFTNATERNLLYILRSAGIMLGTGKQVLKVPRSRRSATMKTKTLSCLNAYLINILFIGVSVATLFVTKMTMDKEKHSSGFKGSVNTYSSSRDRTTNNTSTNDLVKKLEDRERELDSLKKQKESRKEDKSANDYYQLKYEKLYHENMIMKNELFELKNLIQRFKKSEGSTQALNEKSKDENQSSDSSSSDE